MIRMTKERRAELSKEVAFSNEAVGPLGEICRELLAEIDACWRERQDMLDEMKQIASYRSGSRNRDRWLDGFDF